MKCKECPYFFDEECECIRTGNVCVEDEISEDRRMEYEAEYIRQLNEEADAEDEWRQGIKERKTKMKKFYVNIVQTYETGIEVFADNEDEARNIAESKYMDGEVKIDHDRDMTSWEMFIEEDKGE